MSNKRKIVLGIGGASGSVYAKSFLDQLTRLFEGTNNELGVVMSDNAKINWEIEIGPFNSSEYPFTFYSKHDFNAPFASGSARFDSMVIVPCSMGILGRISSGVSDNLMLRAADVMLKERRKLILVPRETPYNLIHLENMKLLTMAGAIICPASPSFYAQPKTVSEVVDTVVHRIIDLLDIENNTYRWGE